MVIDGAYGISVLPSVAERIHTLRTDRSGRVAFPLRPSEAGLIVPNGSITECGRDTPPPWIVANFRSALAPSSAGSVRCLCLFPAFQTRGRYYSHDDDSNRLQTGSGTTGLADQRNT